MEDGTHDELISLQGSYYNMLRSGKNDNSQDANDADNKSLITEKSVEKQLFTHSANIQSRNASSMFPLTANFYLIYIQFIVIIFLVVDTNDQPEKEIVEPFEIWKTLKRIIALARPEWAYIFVAAVCSILIGASFPCIAIIFGEFYGVCRELFTFS